MADKWWKVLLCVHWVTGGQGEGYRDGELAADGTVDLRKTKWFNDGRSRSAPIAAACS